MLFVQPPLAPLFAVSLLQLSRKNWSQQKASKMTMMAMIAKVGEGPQKHAKISCTPPLAPLFAVSLLKLPRKNWSQPRMPKSDTEPYLNYVFESYPNFTKARMTARMYQLVRTRHDRDSNPASSPCGARQGDVPPVDDTAYSRYNLDTTHSLQAWAPCHTFRSCLHTSSGSISSNLKRWDVAMSLTSSPSATWSVS